MPLDGSLFGPAVDAANRYGIPPDLFLRQINQESGFNPAAYNPSSGATGVAQIVPSTAANPGYGISPVDPNDPMASLDFAAHYDSVLYGKTGSYTGMLNSYGTGTNNPAGDIATALDGGAGGFGGGGFTNTSNSTDSGIANGLCGMFGYGCTDGTDSGQPGTSQSTAGTLKSGSWNQWFVRGGVVLLALIFVFVGLNGFIRTGKL